MNKLDIVCAGSDLGVHINGTSLGPAVLMKNNTLINVNKVFDIVANNSIRKCLDINNKKKNLDEINGFNNKLYHIVYNCLCNRNIPLTIGGDHSISIASSLASIKRYHNLGLIWFDAHADFNTFKTTNSGNIHGLPLATITNYEKKFLSDFHSGNFYNCKNTVIVGARDIEPLELENLKDAGVTFFSTEDIRKYGTDTIYSKAFRIASNCTNGIHISYDLDVLDPNLAPGVSVPVANGLTISESNYFIQYILKYRNLIKSLDLVEFNPLKDINNKTLLIASDIINQFQSLSKI